MGTRIYAHFLGYSAAEGGIVEIFTQDTFDMGTLDIITGEREFSDIEFEVPYSSIFDTYQPDSESFLLTKPMVGGTLSTLLPESANTFTADGLRELVVGDLLWVENERIEVTDIDFGPNGYYLALRGLNGSLATSHFLNSTYYGQSNVVMTTKRLRPTGLIVKIYDDNDKIYFYGQVSECTINNASSVTVKCKNLYSQLDSSIIIKNTSGSYNSLSACIKYGYIDFFVVFDYLSLPINMLFKADSENDQRYAKISNAKEGFEQMLNLNNCFLAFDSTTGRYVTKQMRKLVGTEEPVTVLLGNVVTNNNGVVETSVFPHIANCKITTSSGEELNISSFDSNFTSEYTGGQSISIDMSSIIDPNGNDVVSIARNKLFFFASIIEQMSISASRYSDTFVIGGFYRFLDIYKYATFYSNINDNVFLCTGKDETKVSFLRILSFASTLVAPAIMMKKSGDNTFVLLDDSDDNFFAYLSTTVSSLSEATNPVTGSLFFEIDDEITLCDADGNISRPVIGDIDWNHIYTVTNPGITGKYYMVSIESNKPFASLQPKNKAYIYEGEGVL